MTYPDRRLQAQNSTTPPLRQPRTVGVFGGTFDPIHEGHLAVARTAREAFRLDLVLFVPAPRPWLRENGPVAAPEDRLAMVHVATEREPDSAVSTVDLERAGPTFTADTLRDLRAAFGALVRFYLILGADSLAYLDKWERIDEVVSRCVIASVGRPGAKRPSDLPEGHPGRGALYVEGPMIDISATEVRRRLAVGETCAGMLPDAVERYIREHGLYGARRERTGAKK